MCAHSDGEAEEEDEQGLLYVGGGLEAGGLEAAVAGDGIVAVGKSLFFCSFVFSLRFYGFMVVVVVAVVVVGVCACVLSVVSILLHAARRAMAAAPLVPKPQQWLFLQIFPVSHPRPTILRKVTP